MQTMVDVQGVDLKREPVTDAVQGMEQYSRIQAPAVGNPSDSRIGEADETGKEKLRGEHGHGSGWRGTKQAKAYAL